MTRRRTVSLEDQLDYDTAACEAAQAVVQALHGPMADNEMMDDDLYVEALTVLKALAEGGWLDPARLSIVQIDDLL